jgi:hypothetical protein
MDYERKHALIKHSVSQLQPFLYRQSVAFFTSDEGDRLLLASGTLVSIGDRLFIATASHAVPDTPDNEIWVLHTEPRLSITPRGSVLKKGRYPKDNPDVGFLELGADAGGDHLRESACPLEPLAVVGVGRPKRPTLLVGSPKEYLKKKQVGEPGAIGLEPVMIGYLAVPVQVSEWPDDLELDPSRHIVLEYPYTLGQRLDSGASIMLPHPEGMSGGGIWDCGFEDDVFWTKQSAKLIGIQSGWCAEAPRISYAIQIIHWLRLVHDHYPDLRPALTRHFPELAGTTGTASARAR